MQLSATPAIIIEENKELKENSTDNKSEKESKAITQDELWTEKQETYTRY